MAYQIRLRFLRTGMTDGVCKEILHEDAIIGYVLYRRKEKELHFSFSLPDTTYLYDFLMVFMHQMMVQFHPQRFITNVNHTNTDQVLEEMLFQRKNHRMIYEMDPLRYQVKDIAFNEKGLIIHQGLMEQIPFGHYNTKEKGCGWIAAYNLLRINHHFFLMEDIIHGLDAHALFHEVMGENVFRLYMFLKQKHLNCILKIGFRRYLLKDIEKYNSGIVLYLHAHGAHYAAFERIDTDRFHFYNGIYGRRNEIESMEDFLHKYSNQPFHFMILVK